MVEAPTPLMIKNIVEFSSTTDKQSKIYMKIIPSSFELEFSAKIIDKIPQKEYFLRETAENLLKNSYLATGGNILGILKILEYFIKKNSYKIYEENNLIKLEIDIEHPIIKFINFILEEKRADINTQVTELSSYVYETLVNKKKSLEEKNKEYENKMQEYEQKVQKLTEINKKNENKINDLEKMIKDIKNELPFHKENVGEQLNLFSINKEKNEAMSQNIVTFNYNVLNLKYPRDKEKLKLHAIQKISEGYFPLFLKVGAEKPHFFYVKSDSSCRLLLDYYNLINGTKKGRIILYNDGKRLDLDTQIKDLNIKQFGVIEGYV